MCEQVLREELGWDGIKKELADLYDKALLPEMAHFVRAGLPS